MVFIMFKGLPQVFTDLIEAEETAAEKCAADHEDRTILAVPRSVLDHQGIVARYRGVTLHALHEIKEEEQ